MDEFFLYSLIERVSIVKEKSQLKHFLVNFNLNIIQINNRLIAQVLDFI